MVAAGGRCLGRRSSATRASLGPWAGRRDLRSPGLSGGAPLTGASLVAAVNRYQLPLILVMAFAAFLPVMNVAVVARNLKWPRPHGGAGGRGRARARAGAHEHVSGPVPPVIEFDAVTFAYHPDEPRCCGISHSRYSQARPWPWSARRGR